MTRGMSSSCPASAIACAWLPDENVTTPRRASSGVSRESALNAPRNLKAPARCRFSHLKKTCAPARSSTRRDVATGVRWATPALCSAALSTSALVGSKGLVHLSDGDRSLRCREGPGVVLAEIRLPDRVVDRDARPVETRGLGDDRFERLMIGAKFFLR